MANKKTEPTIQVEWLDEPVEVSNPAEVEEIIEAAVVETIVKSGEYFVAEGDTYALLGKKFVKSGETPFEAAQRIMAANNGKALIAGEVVKF